MLITVSVITKKNQYLYDYSIFNFSPEHKRQKLDRRRIESAFFQYAALRVASFHPDLFQNSKLPLHSESQHYRTNDYSLPWCIHEKIFT